MKLGVCYYPEQWPQEMWAADAKRMVQMGITHVRIGEFAWSRIEPARDQFQWDWLDKAVDILAQVGLEITLCTPTATPPKWLIDEKPDILAWDAQGHPRRFGSRRHYCFSSPVYQAESQRITRAVVVRYALNLAVTSWQTDNEYGCHDTVESYSPAAQAAFRVWLKAKYHTIAALNVAWGTVFWSQAYKTFAQIDLPNMTVTEPNPAHCLDFQRFSSDQVIAFNRDQVEIIREETDANITHNVMGHFTAFDHYDLGRDLDIVTWDSYPLGFLDQEWWREDQKLRWMRTGHPDFAAFHHDLYRTCGTGRWGVMEQQPGPVNWAPNNPAPQDGMVSLWALEAAAHGADYLSYFRWRQAPFAQEQNHAGLYRSDGTLAQGGVEAKAAADMLQILGPVKTGQAKIALIFDYSATWMFDIQGQGADWHYEKLCFEFYTCLRRLGQSVDILSPHHDLSGYKVVIAPSLPVIPDGFFERVSKAGAVVLLGPRSGSKTADFQNNHDALPTGRRLAAESVRAGATFEVTMDEQFYRGKIWRDIMEANSADSTTVQAACEDGSPAYIKTGGVHQLTVWPEPKFMRAIIRPLLSDCGIETSWLPKDLRVRQAGNYGFAFHYGTKPISLTRFYPDADYVIGGPDMPPSGVSVWRL